MANLT
jgi:hypothetical protein